MRTVSKGWTYDDIPAGEAVLLDYPTHCSACWGQGDHSFDKEGVVLAVITLPRNIGKADFWHGWWSCPKHWEHGVIRPRWEATGSVTPY